jgi:hypothetical protein
MDTLEKTRQYRFIVKDLLTEYASYKPSCEGIEIKTIFDTDEDRYLVLSVGWHETKWMYGNSMHIDIIAGKIWIQLNNTEIDLGEELVKRGVPKADIVIGFLPPEIREYSDYAVV